MKEKTILGVIVGNRGFFPAHLVKSGRESILKVLQEEGIEAVALGTEVTLHGGVSTFAEAEMCAGLFQAHRDEIDGILVTLPNFGDEKAVADTIRLANLNVPVLVHAFNDDANQMANTHRRDSFCGKMSVCNNLGQYGIRYTLTTLHTQEPTSESFRRDVRQFTATCRVVRGLRNLRVGALGARPTAFNTVRYSEKLLERYSISVDTMDLSEALGRCARIQENDPALKAKLDEMAGYVSVKQVPAGPLLKMARLALVIDRWMEENRLQATAIQCWTAIEQFYGITPCTVMSMMSNKLLPSACETDVTGVVSMYAMLLASGRPSALLDWNNNYGEDPDKTVVFHCSNLPADIFEQTPMMTYSDIFADDVGKENAYGTIAGRIKAQPFTFCRVSTNDFTGQVMTYVGEGRFTDDQVVTFGGYGVAHVDGLQDLLKYACYNNFEHHVAVNPSLCAAAVHEALSKYLGWEVYYHRQR